MPAHAPTVEQRFDRMAVRRMVLIALYVSLPIVLVLLSTYELKNMRWYSYFVPSAGGGVAPIALYHWWQVIWPYAVSACFVLPNFTGAFRNFVLITSALLITTAVMCIWLLTPIIDHNEMPLSVMTIMQAAVLVIAACLASVKW